MSATKTMRECYEIRHAGEWANIMLAIWDRPSMTGSGMEIAHGGEIAIHSSFGSWAYTWTACGVSFKRFLCGIDFDYAFTKFMGARLRKFDGEATLNQIKREIIRQRRQTDLSAESAREVWELVDWGSENIEGSNPTAYGHEMQEIGEALSFNHPMREYFLDPCAWPNVTRYDEQAVGFWRDIWPEFTKALKAEAAEGVPA